jgi:hypothetical protein
MKAITTTRSMILLAALSLPLAGWGAEAQSSGADHAAHQNHADHQMTQEQLATLRSKIPLYAGYTDEQIHESMARMTDSEAYLSAPGVRGEVGVLALGHGYGEKGNQQFKNGYAKIATVHPTAAGLGMAMMDSAHIQKAVDDLVAAGAKTIVVVPTEVGQETSLIRQWDYIFGRTDVSSYLDVPRVKTTARIVMAQTPTRSPIVARVLADHVKGISTNPAAEAALLIMHGPEDARDNQNELANLRKTAEAVQQATGVSAIHAASLQDDAPQAIRQANVNRMRQWIEQQIAAGKKVLVAPVLMTSGGTVTAKLTRDLGGLNYTVADRGITEHPLFDQWVRDTVAAALKQSG